MKTELENLLQSINPTFSIEWINNKEGVFNTQNRNRYFNGKIIMNSDQSISINNITSNYNNSYLEKKVKTKVSGFNLDFISNEDGFSLYEIPKIGDIILLKDTPDFKHLKVDDNVQLKFSDKYYQINNGAIECSPIGTLKQDFNATVISIFKSTCNKGSDLTYYIKFKL